MPISKITLKKKQSKMCMGQRPHLFDFICLAPSPYANKTHLTKQNSVQLLQERLHQYIHWLRSHLGY